MKKFPTCFILLLILQSAFCWTRTYGGAGTDAFNDIISLPDNNFLAVGYTNSVGAGGYDFWVVWLDEDGDMLREIAIGGPNDDRAEAVAAVHDGFIIVGSTNSYGIGIPGYSNMRIVKIDTIGGIVWHTLFGTSLDDVATDVIVADDKIIVVGYTWLNLTTRQDEAVLLSFTHSGALDTFYYFGALGNDGFYGVTSWETGYAATGYTKSFGVGTPAYSNVLLATDASDEIYWGGVNDDVGKAISYSDDIFTIVGNTYSIGAGNSDVYVAYVSLSGSLISQFSFGGAMNDFGEDLVEVDGNIVIAGFTNSFGAGYDDVLVVKMGPSGETIWQKVYGSAGNEQAKAIVKTLDDGFFVVGRKAAAGSAITDGYAILLDSYGDTITYSPMVVDAGSDITGCHPVFDTLFGTVSGGSPPYTYFWEPAEGVICPNCPVTGFVAYSTTVYHFTVTDDEGIVASDSVVVRVSSPIADAGEDIAISVGSSAIIGGSPTASGGIPPYSYLWSPTTGLSNPWIANPVAFPMITTTYYLTITDSIGCTGFDSITITVLGDVIEPQKPAIKTFYAVPNPFNSYCRLFFGKSTNPRVLKIFSLNGKLIQDMRIEADLDEINWHPNDISSGIYRICLDSEEILVIYLK